jgi:hypothetical protein
MQLIIITLLGGAIVVDVAPSDPMRHVRELIFAKVGMPACDQRLIYAGRELDDDHTVADYSLPAEATIHLAGRLVWRGNLTVVVRTPEGAMVPVPMTCEGDVLGKWTNRDLVEAVAGVVGVAPHRQVLRVEGRRVDYQGPMSPLALAHLGVVDGTVVDLEVLPE